MNLIINQIKVSLDFEEAKVIDFAQIKYHIHPDDVKQSKILKKSVDSRKNQILLVYSVYFELSKDYSHLLKYADINLYQLKEEIEIKKYNADTRPVIIGFGPSGMFSALILARANLKPIIIEQGKKVEERLLDIDKMNQEGLIDPFSNTLFGEGGAGTFSDGKLTTGIKSEYIRYILKEFIRFGANENIYYDQKPHIGTDVLQKVVANMRREIEKLGGEFYYSHQFQNFNYRNEDSLYEIETTDLKNHEIRLFQSKHLILATGHSLRQNYELFIKKSLQMQAKSFSMGVRIEHLKRDIDKIQLKEFSEHPKLRYSDYKLAHKCENGRTLYTFCMCPGGEVIFSSHDSGRINVNGMSYQARNSINSNSALLVNVDVADYYNSSVLDGIDFIEKYEAKAFEKVGELRVPVQRLGDFLKNQKSSRLGKILPSCKIGFKLIDLNEILPSFVSKTIKDGIRFFDHQMPGFASPDAILTGIEARSSSPITIFRDENLMTNLKNIYAVGEGSGHAGGITSSCVDGIKIALKILDTL